MINNKPQISIIIPVYNVEKYLPKCIDSVLNQTFKDFECILVNDGSIDNSSKICDEYAKKDTRLKVIHKVNGGVSSARNAGLDIANGTWICFVDSDDWCDPEMLAFLYMNAENKDVDVSICGFRRMEDEKKVKAITKKRKDVLLNRKNALIKLFTANYFDTNPFCKLFKKELLMNNNTRLYFDESIHCGEDTLFLYYLFKNINMIYYSSNVYYNYRWRDNSATVSNENIPIVMTGLNIYKKILLEETDKTIIRKINKSIACTFGNIYMRYLINKNLIYDNDYFFIKKNFNSKLKFIILYGSLIEKMKYSLLIFPFFFRILYLFNKKYIEIRKK